MSKKSGFTLIEIMIVVVVILILAAIAIPSFIKARDAHQFQMESKNKTPKLEWNAVSRVGNLSGGIHSTTTIIDGHKIIVIIGNTGIAALNHPDCELCQ